MLFFDANVIVYSIVNLGEKKLRISQELINMAADNDLLLISPLILQEVIYTLGKLKVEPKVIEENFNLWKNFLLNSVDEGMIEDAFDLCVKLNAFTIINDAIHLKFAEKYCEKIFTFDNHFRRFEPFTGLEIKILQD